MSSGRSVTAICAGSSPGSFRGFRRAALHCGRATVDARGDSSDAGRKLDHADRTGYLAAVYILDANKYLMNSQVTDGIDADDLRDWTGSSTLVEAYPECVGDYFRGNDRDQPCAGWLGTTLKPAQAHFAGSLSPSEWPEARGISASDLRWRSYLDAPPWLLSTGADDIEGKRGLLRYIPGGDRSGRQSTTGPQPVSEGVQSFGFYYPDYRTDFPMGDNPYRYYRW